MSILSLLPAQNEKRDNLIRRYNDIIRAAAHRDYYDGMFISPHNPNVQAVLKALFLAINKKEEKGMARRNMSITPNKTAHDKASPSYKTPEQRKKEKSARSQQIRLEMQGGKGKR